MPTLIQNMAMLAGALTVTALTLPFANEYGARTVARLSGEARQVADDVGARPVSADFRSRSGWPSRHAILSGGEDLPDSEREEVAKAIGQIPGVGGVFWSDGTVNAESGTPATTPLHCQDDVEALLRARSIRFEESSALIDPASRMLLGEVAEALRPCTGSIVAIVGHTDKSGPEPGNLALSQERADAVRAALVARGIPGDGLRAQGVGSRVPVDGLDPADPANRRIEFFRDCDTAHPTHTRRHSRSALSHADLDGIVNSGPAGLCCRSGSGMAVLGSGKGMIGDIR